MSKFGDAIEKMMVGKPQPKYRTLQEMWITAFSHAPGANPEELAVIASETLDEYSMQIAKHEPHEQLWVDKTRSPITEGAHKLGMQVNEVLTKRGRE